MSTPDLDETFHVDFSEARQPQGEEEADFLLRYQSREWDADYTPPPPRRSTWTPLDTATTIALALGKATPPSILQRSDGPSLLYRGKVHGIMGEPESGKGWVACHAVQQVLHGGGVAVYIDFEDTGVALVRRLLALGVPIPHLEAGLLIFEPAEELTARGTEHLANILKIVRPDLVVLDGITAALTLNSLDPNKNEEVTRWFKQVPMGIAHSQECNFPAVLMIDHVTKAKDDRGRYAIGAGAKLAQIDGCQLVAEVEEPFAPGRMGRARISVTKDRPGEVRRFASGEKHVQHVADFTMTPHGEKIVATLRPPTPVDKDKNVKKKKGEIMAFLRLQPSTVWFTKNALRAEIGGQHDDREKAINRLVEEHQVLVDSRGRIQAASPSPSASSPQQESPPEAGQ